MSIGLSGTAARNGQRTKVDRHGQNKIQGKDKIQGKVSYEARAGEIQSGRKAIYVSGPSVTPTFLAGGVRRSMLYHITWTYYVSCVLSRGWSHFHIY